MTEKSINHPKVSLFATNEKLVTQFGREIIERLSKAISDKGQASLVVSGGSTPKSLFQFLSEQDIDWSKVTITLADERCLPQAHENSNARLLRENLLTNHAAKATFIPLYEDDESASYAAEHATKKLSSQAAYDVLILGMGTDGHTASLFPEASNLSDALASNAPSCMAIDPVTNDMLRVTQTKQRLLNSNWIVFHLVGENKIDTLNAVLADTDKTIYPSSHFIHQTETPVDIYFAHKK